MGDNTVVVSVCIIYFAVMVGIGMIAARKNKETSDYLVAGRKLNVTMTAITLAAVQIGVGIVLSSATNGYNEGVWPGMYYAFGCGGGLIIAGLVTTKKLREEEGYVPLDYFAQRYGDSKGIRLWAWISNVPSLLGIFIAQLLASGGILAGFGIPFKTGVIITAVVILIYCTVGGMWGVVLTDVVQTAIIAVGVPILQLLFWFSMCRQAEMWALFFPRRLSRREWVQSSFIWFCHFCCLSPFLMMHIPEFSLRKMQRLQELDVL